MLCLLWEDDTFSHILLRGLVNDNLGPALSGRLWPSPHRRRRINQLRIILDSILFTLAKTMLHLMILCVRVVVSGRGLLLV